MHVIFLIIGNMYMHTNDVFVIRLKLFHWNNKKAEYFVYFMQIGQMEEGREGQKKSI